MFHTTGFIHIILVFHIKKGSTPLWGRVPCRYTQASQNSKLRLVLCFFLVKRFHNGATIHEEPLHLQQIIFYEIGRFTLNLSVNFITGTSNPIFRNMVESQCLENEATVPTTRRFTTSRARSINFLLEKTIYRKSHSKNTTAEERGEKIYSPPTKVDFQNIWVRLTPKSNDGAGCYYCIHASLCRDSNEIFKSREET